MTTWRRFWRMSGYARGCVLEAACGLLITRAGLAIVGFRRWRAALKWLTDGAGKRNGAVAQAEVKLAREIERWESTAARHLPLRTNCLDRSMTLWWMSRRRGIAAELRIGGRKKEERFEAHAWVEVGGVAVSDEVSVQEFAAFAEPLGAVQGRAS